MNEITLHSLDQLLAHLDQNPKTKGIEFERSCKWFLENDPEYKQKLQKVWLWSDWPGSNGKRDTGIDLIAQDIEGKIWAIQVKAYNENNSITKAGIDSFLSASNRSDISFRLLIATTNKIGSIGRDTFADQEKPISLCLRDKLEISPVDWMLSLTDTKFIPKDIKIPRDHQQQALDAIIKGFEIVPSKGQVHMACGTGKSLLGLWLSQKLQAQYTLVLVPSISLVAQLRRIWAENSGDFVFDSISVCSDQTVGYKHSDERQEAFEMGFPATTNAQELVQQLLLNSRPKVIFSTYHSSMVIEQACKLKPDLIFDLVIADEAHRCVGKVQSDFAIITDDNKIRARRKLYMTATPRIYTEYVKNKAKEYECEIASMDDEERFGPVLYRLPFSDAIKQELLTDYQVIISVIDHSTYRDYAEKGKIINIDDYETDARKIATQLLIAQAIQKYSLKKIISFHNGVSVAQDFVQTIPKALELLPQDQRPQIDYCNVVHGEQSQSERYKILKNFDNEDFTGAVIIGNDRCLREGVDIPALDGIVFADPKNSEVDIIQAVGRAIRLSDDKKFGTIIIPVFVDKQSQGVENLENSCFKKIWQIIKALRAHDDVLAEELDTIRLELGKRSYKAPAKLPSKIITDIPVLDKVFARLIEAKIVKDIIQQSNIWTSFEDAREFVFKLKLKSATDWKKYISGQILDLPPLPNDIPRAPKTVYKDMGWINWGHFLGTNIIATRLRGYLPYEEACKFVHNLGLKTKDDWKKYIKGGYVKLPILPHNISASPDKNYKRKNYGFKWTTWGHFLGTSRMSNKSFEDAREFARSLKFKTQNDWFQYVKANEGLKDIPAYPNEAYKIKGWINWGDWLGTGRIASQNYQCKSFEEAREFVRTLSLKNNKEWRAWSKSDARLYDIPTGPDQRYRDEGWISWGDFLGNNNIASTQREFRDFDEVKAFVKNIGFTSRTEWEEWLNSDERPIDIPSNPSKAYKKEWNGWGNFLGTGTIAHVNKQFRPFFEARSFARGLSLKSKNEWAEWTKQGTRPADIPTEPSRTYAHEGWLNWKDWLGTSKQKI